MPIAVIDLLRTDTSATNGAEVTSASCSTGWSTRRQTRASIASNAFQPPYMQMAVGFPTAVNHPIAAIAIELACSRLSADAITARIDRELGSRPLPGPVLVESDPDEAIPVAQ